MKKIKPKKFIFDHQLKGHTSKQMYEFIIHTYNDWLIDCYNRHSWPLWKVEDWLYFLDECILDCHNDGTYEKDYKELVKFMNGHKKEFEYIIVGD